VGVECRLERLQDGAVGAVSGALVLVDAGVCSGYEDAGIVGDHSVGQHCEHGVELGVGEH
jgi:hypothetical protein